MTKIEKLTEITGKATAPAASTFLGQAKGVIKDLKELLTLARELKGLDTSLDNEPTRSLEVREKPAAGGFNQVIQALIAKGYGDVPIGDIITELSPFTIKQLMEIAKNARPQK